MFSTIKDTVESIYHKGLETQIGKAYQCSAEDEKLAGIRSSFNESGTTFLGFDIDVTDDEKPEVVALGFSHWERFRDETKKDPLTSFSYWEVEGTRHPDAGMPRRDSLCSEHHVRQSETGELLGEMIEDLAQRYNEVILVGHDLRYKFDILQRSWSFPQNVITVDVQLLWQARHRDFKKVSLEECGQEVEGVNILQEPRNAGNRAQYSVRLLHGLIMEGKDLEKKTTEDLDKSTMEDEHLDNST
ncbi:hypothetical protein GGR56DRAFT_654273 [Xylariaceae sp. FL0804]|nr:hypothetical protein GGR56DRAFT_654273 [Xylariaceae sp. FL0804]